MNFIVITVDTFRFDNLAAHAHARGRFRAPAREVMTPNLDRFAQQCIVFDRAYCGGFPTVPNRKDLFKGRTTFPFDSRWSPLEPDAVTFVRLLAEAGCETMTVQDCPHLIPGGFGFDRDFHGWELVRGQEGDRLASWRAAQPGDPAKSRAKGQWRQHIANVERARRFEEDCFSAQTLRLATRWLEGKYRRDPRGPFLLYIDAFDPHEPWDAPQWYEDLYDPGYEGVVYRYPEQGRADVFAPAELAHLRSVYAAEVTMVDRWLGHLFATIEAMCLLDNTCIVFTSDHGHYFGEHGWIGKSNGSLYEELAHIPLFIHLPGQTRSRRFGALVQPCDLMPTMLDLAGITRPETVTGYSLAPLFDGPIDTKAAAVRDHAFSGIFLDDIHRQHGIYRRVTITNDEWALCYPDQSVRSRSDGGAAISADSAPALAAELFHLPSDPHQLTNVLAPNRAIAAAMWDAYAAWLRAVKAPDDFPVPPRP